MAATVAAARNNLVDFNMVIATLIAPLGGKEEKNMGRSRVVRSWGHESATSAIPSKLDASVLGLDRPEYSA
jgi:hypothetical protein